MSGQRSSDGAQIAAEAVAEPVQRPSSAVQLGRLSDVLGSESLTSHGGARLLHSLMMLPLIKP
jgi:hypothetical protein